MSDYYQAQLIARQIMEDTGMTLDQVLKLDMNDYARLSGRPTPVAAALSAVNVQEHQEPPAALPDEAFTQQAVPEPPGRTLEELALTNDDAWLAWRANRVSGGEGKGLLDSVGGSQSAEFRSAGRKHAGRTGWSTSNVTEPPRIEGRYLRHDDQLDHRSAAERLSNAANLWQGR